VICIKEKAAKPLSLSQLSFFCRGFRRRRKERLLQTSTHNVGTANSSYPINNSSRRGCSSLPPNLDVEKWPSPAIVLASVTYFPLAASPYLLLLDEHCISEEFAAARFRWRMKFSAKGKGPGTDRRTSSSPLSSSKYRSCKQSTGSACHLLFGRVLC